jgi:hypothetical protein
VNSTVRLMHVTFAAERTHLREVVRDPDDRDAFARELSNHLHETLGADLVHARHRLVEHEHRGLGDQGLRDQDALAFAARQAAELALVLADEAHAR